MWVGISSFSNGFRIFSLLPAQNKLPALHPPPEPRTTGYENLSEISFLIAILVVLIKYNLWLSKAV